MITLYIVANHTNYIKSTFLDVTNNDFTTGVNISPYFLDARHGKGFGFYQILGKVLRCKLENSGFSVDFWSK